MSASARRGSTPRALSIYNLPTPSLYYYQEWFAVNSGMRYSGNAPSAWAGIPFANGSACSESFTGCGRLFLPNYAGSLLKVAELVYVDVYGAAYNQTYLGHYGCWFNSQDPITSIQIAAAGNLEAGSVFTVIGHGAI